MKLNPNCIRAILLTAEELCTFNKPWIYDEDGSSSKYLAEYCHEEIIYHISQAERSGLSQDVHYYDGGATILICDLTPYGHEFLANIRNDSVWKKVMSKAAGASLPILFEVAKDAAMKYFLI